MHSIVHIVPGKLFFWKDIENSNIVFANDVVRMSWVVDAFPGVQLVTGVRMLYNSKKHSECTYRANVISAYMRMYDFDFKYIKEK